LYRLDESARAKTPSMTAPVAAGVATFVRDFIDVRCAIALRSSANPGVYAALAPGHIQELHVRSLAGGATITLNLAGAALASVPPPRPAPALLALDPADPMPHTFDVGTIFEREVRRLLGLLLPPLPNSVDLELSITSAGPCDLVISAFKLEFGLVQERFAPGADGRRPPKQVLRFAGSSRSQNSVEVELPRQAVIEAATLRAVFDLRADRPLPEDDDTVTPVEPAGAQGALLKPGIVAGQRVCVPAALSATGVALGLLPIAPGTRLSVQLEEDYQGAPSGRKLAAATVDLSEPGRRAWATLLFDAPTVITTDPHWLIATVARGAAVWLVARDESTVALFEQPAAPNDRGGLLARGALPGCHTLYRFLSRTEPSREQSVDPGCAVSIADAQIPPGDPTADERIYVLSTALSSHFEAHAATSSAVMVRVPITFTSLTAGLVTVYPPTVRYQISQ
jgi:hypothetical protein